jgi:predicted RNA binding protein YcfA (HicA-like mRNA interferase family)
MPKKIRELKAMLRKAGFRWRPGKGSHTIWEHPLADKAIVLSGKDGRDVRWYQEDQVIKQLAAVERRRRQR